MDLQASKLELVKMIVNINSQKLIDRMMEVIQSEEEDFWFELSEIEKREIEIGISQLDAGMRINANDFFNKVAQH